MASNDRVPRKPNNWFRGSQRGRGTTTSYTQQQRNQPYNQASEAQQGFAEQSSSGSWSEVSGASQLNQQVNTGLSANDEVQQGQPYQQTIPQSLTHIPSQQNTQVLTPLHGRSDGKALRQNPYHFRRQENWTNNASGTPQDPLVIWMIGPTKNERKIKRQHESVVEEFGRATGIPYVIIRAGGHGTTQSWVEIPGIRRPVRDKRLSDFHITVIGGIYRDQPDQAAHIFVTTEEIESVVEGVVKKELVWRMSGQDRKYPDSTGVMSKEPFEKWDYKAIHYEDPPDPTKNWFQNPH